MTDSNSLLQRINSGILYSLNQLDPEECLFVLVSYESILECIFEESIPPTIVITPEQKLFKIFLCLEPRRLLPHLTSVIEPELETECVEEPCVSFEAVYSKSPFPTNESESNALIRLEHTLNKSMFKTGSYHLSLKFPPNYNQSKTEADEKQPPSVAICTLYKVDKAFFHKIDSWMSSKKQLSNIRCSGPILTRLCLYTQLVRSKEPNTSSICALLSALNKNSPLSVWVPLDLTQQQSIHEVYTQWTQQDPVIQLVFNTLSEYLFGVYKNKCLLIGQTKLAGDLLSIPKLDDETLDKRCKKEETKENKHEYCTVETFPSPDQPEFYMLFHECETKEDLIQELQKLHAYVTNKVPETNEVYFTIRPSPRQYAYHFHPSTSYEFVMNVIPNAGQQGEEVELYQNVLFEVFSTNQMIKPCRTSVFDASSRFNHFLSNTLLMSSYMDSIFCGEDYSKYCHIFRTRVMYLLEHQYLHTSHLSSIQDCTSSSSSSSSLSSSPSS